MNHASKYRMEHDEAPTMDYCEEHQIHEGYTDEGLTAFTFPDQSVLYSDGFHMLLDEDLA